MPRRKYSLARRARDEIAARHGGAVGKPDEHLDVARRSNVVTQDQAGATARESTCGAGRRSEPPAASFDCDP